MPKRSTIFGHPSKGFALGVTLTITLLLTLTLAGLTPSGAPATPSDAVRRTWGEPVSPSSIFSARAFPRVHLALCELSTQSAD